MEKRDGRFLLAIWQGVESSVYSETDDKIADIEHRPRSLNLKLNTKITTARLYNLSFSLDSIKSYDNPKAIRSVSLAIPDHVLVVELTPLTN